MNRKSMKQQNPSETALNESIFTKYKGPFPLHDAAAENDVEAVKLLSARKDVNALNQVIEILGEADGLSPLIIAARKGHIKVVETLIELDCDVNLNDKGTEDTAIHYASLSGHDRVIDTLLKHGSVLHFRDKEGIYPLHLAAQAGHCLIIEQLKSVQGDLDCRDNNGACPVHYAANHNQVEALYKLQEFGADILAEDKNGSTALHYAARSDSTEAIITLIRLGIDIDSQCKNGDTPLHYAVRADKKVAIKTLVEAGARMDVRNEDKECSIHTASRLGLSASVRMLVKCGNDVSVTHKQGRQCVHIAAENGCCDVLKVLHGVRANLNAADKHRDRPIHYAVRSDSQKAIQKLAELKADLNAQGKKGYTALHLASKKRKTNIVNLLGSLGADCNVENEIAVFPIYYAANNSDLATTKCLLRHGAKLSKLNSDGQAMVHVMVEDEKLDGLCMFGQMKANLSLCNETGDTVIHIATKNEQSDVLEHLKSIGADINSCNKFGLSALHVAALDGNSKHLKMLMKLGLDIGCKSKDFDRGSDFPKRSKSRWPPKGVRVEDYWKIKSFRAKFDADRCLHQSFLVLFLYFSDKKENFGINDAVAEQNVTTLQKVGMSPIQCAVLAGHRDIVQELAKGFADVNSVNEDGETVFHMAAWFGLTEWYRYLLSMGADRNAKDRFGRVPLHYAAYTGDLASVRALLKYGALLESVDEDGRLPLHYVAEGGHFLLIPEFMTVKTSDINCVDKHGQTPLHLASSAGMVDTIIELLQLGADITARDKNGNTPMHCASASGSHEVIVQLASNGVDVNARNTDLKSPLHVAAEKGQGEAMEYLLMCGGDPNLKDKNDLQPSLYKLFGHMKAAVAKRINEFNSHNWARHSTGEIGYESRKITSGTPVEFPKLSIWVSIESEVSVSPTIFLFRSSPDVENVEIPLHGLEEILSDKYELRVLNLDYSCKLMLDIPLDGYPGEFESFLRTTDGKEFKEITTSEENGVPYLKAAIPIAKGTSEKFSVVVRPTVHKHQIPKGGGTIRSEVDNRIRVEIPKGTFYEDTSLQLQVLKTDDTERTQGFLISDVVNVKTEDDRQLHQSVMLKLPLHDKRQDTENIVVFAVENENDVEDETKWQVVKSRTKIQNESIVFSVEHFSIYFTVAAIHSSLAEIKRQAKEQIKRTKQRETSVVFFYAAVPKKNCFLTIFECTTPGRFKRRSEYWLREGFLLHPQVRHSGHFVARPNQKYKFTVSGNLQHAGAASKDFSLIFNPRAFKYQSFYLTKVIEKQPWIGEINVTTPCDALSRDTNDNADNETFVTSVPVEISQDSKCPIS